MKNIISMLLVFAFSTQVFATSNIENIEAQPNIEVIKTEAEAVSYASNLSDSQMTALRRELERDGENCTYKYRKWVLAPAVGVSVTVILIPVSLAYMVVGLPVAGIDKLQGCKGDVLSF